MRQYETCVWGLGAWSSVGFLKPHLSMLADVKKLKSQSTFQIKVYVIVGFSMPCLLKAPFGESTHVPRAICSQSQ